MSTFSELHIIAMFVSQGILNTERSIPVVGTVNSNLCLFRLTWAGGRDDFSDRSGHGRTWLFWNSCSIQIQLGYPCGSGHARLCHFLHDAGTRRVIGLCLSFLMRHALHDDIEMEAILFPFAHFRDNLLIPLDNITFGFGKTKRRLHRKWPHHFPIHRPTILKNDQNPPQ
jgi:hypothetical protein